MPETKANKPVPARTESITQAILLLRGQKVLLDSVLAALYGVQARTLNQAVKRNRERFPQDFMFQLSWKEAETLRSQNVILDSAGTRSQTVSLKRGANIKYRPYAFTEQGVAMLSSVLRSRQAVQVNIEIMRAFVRLREAVASNKELARKFAELERRIERKLTNHDRAITAILNAIRELMAPQEAKQKRPIGFVNAQGELVAMGGTRGAHYPGKSRSVFSR